MLCVLISPPLTTHLFSCHTWWICAAFCVTKHNELAQTTIWTCSSLFAYLHSFLFFFSCVFGKQSHPETEAKIGCGGRCHTVSVAAVAYRAFLPPKQRTTLRSPRGTPRSRGATAALQDPRLSSTGWHVSSEGQPRHAPLWPAVPGDVDILRDATPAWEPVE